MSLLVIGIGNPDRGDDAAGWEVVKRLPGVARVVMTDGDPVRLMHVWEGEDRVVLVDAIATGGEPGTVMVFDLTRDPLPTRAVPSSHGLGPGEAVELGKLLGCLPESLVLVGIEAGDFTAGQALGARVAQGVDEAVRLINSWASLPARS